MSETCISHFLKITLQSALIYVAKPFHQESVKRSFHRANEVWGSEHFFTKFLASMDAIAEHVRSKRIRDRTKQNYRGKLNTIKVFLLSQPGYSVHVHGDKILVPLPEEVVRNLFGWLSVNTDLPKKKKKKNGAHVEESDSDSDDEPDPPAQDDIFADKKATISASCMQGYKSALSWLYAEQEANPPMSPAFEKWITGFIHGYKKKIADKKAAGVMSVTEGKSKLAFTGYNEICKHLMKKAPIRNKNTWAQGIFGWAFMTLCWNLMARGDSVRNVMLQHIDWKNDCMTVTFARHKGDPTGEGLGNEKHVYANPLAPHICPILAMAVLVFTCHRGPNVAGQGLFEGGNSDGRFGKILAGIIAELPENILGADPADIGTHSNRKGSTSFVLAFVVISAVQVYLRAGWSLGDVPDRYIFAGAGGDQIVGRAVCGLPINGKEFGTLPPHFVASDIAALNEIGWEHILEGYEYYPACFQRVVPYLLASLLYHEAFLREELDKNHPLWNQKVFTALIPGTSHTVADAFKSKAVTGLGTCRSTNMRATGVPPHLDIVMEVDGLRQAVVELADAGKRDREEIIKAVQGVPALVKTCILANFSVDGVVPVTTSELHRAIQDSSRMIIDTISTRLQGNVVPAPSPSSEPPETVEARHFRTFQWADGSLGRYVPENFCFPSQDAKTLWDLWHYGNAAEGILPYRRLCKGHEDDLQTKAEQSLLSRTLLVMDKIREIAESKNLLQTDQDVGTLTRAVSDNIFYTSYAQLLSDLYGARHASDRGGGNNTAEMANVVCATLANKIYKKRKAGALQTPHNVNLVSP